MYYTFNQSDNYKPMFGNLISTSFEAPTDNQEVSFDEDNTYDVSTETTTITTEQKPVTIQPQQVAADGGEAADAEEDTDEDDEAVYACPVTDCEKTFDKKANLARHWKNSDGHSPDFDDDPDVETLHVCSICEDEPHFDTTDALDAHVRDSHEGIIVVEDDDDGGVRFEPLPPSEQESYPDELPPTNPEDDSIEAMLRHNWDIYTNPNDPLGIDYNRIHINESLRFTRNPFKRGALRLARGVNYYFDLNRQAARALYDSGKDLARSSKNTLIATGKTAFAVTLLEMTSMPLRAVLRRTGITRAVQNVAPVAVNINRAGYGIAFTGAVSTGLLASLPAALGAGSLLAYLGNEDFRDWAQQKAQNVKETISDAAHSAWDFITSPFSDAEHAEERLVNDAVLLS